MRFIFLIQARLGSTRLPRKVLEEIASGQPLIKIVYERIMRSSYANRKNTIVLTTDSPNDDELVEYLKKENITCYRGCEHNVYDRYYKYLKSLSVLPEYFFRICADNPFIEPIFIDQLADSIKKDKSSADYISFQDKHNTPAILTNYGLFCELIKTKSFFDACKYIETKEYAEHVTPIFYKSQYYKCRYLKIPKELCDYPFRMTIDTMEDLSIVRDISLLIDIKKTDYKQLVECVKSNVDKLLHVS